MWAWTGLKCRSNKSAPVKTREHPTHHRVRAQEPRERAPVRPPVQSPSREPRTRRRVSCPRKSRGPPAVARGASADACLGPQMPSRVRAAKPVSACKKQEATGHCGPKPLPRAAPQPRATCSGRAHPKAPPLRQPQGTDSPKAGTCQAWQQPWRSPSRPREQRSPSSCLLYTSPSPRDS